MVLAALAEGDLIIFMSRVNERNETQLPVERELSSSKASGSGPETQLYPTRQAQQPIPSCKNALCTSPAAKCRNSIGRVGAGDGKPKTWLAESLPIVVLGELSEALLSLSAMFNCDFGLLGSKRWGGIGSAKKRVMIHEGLGTIEYLCRQAHSTSYLWHW